MKLHHKPIVYSVVTVRVPLDEKEPTSSRLVGLFVEKEDAREIIRNNMGDIFEYYYRYAVIEQVELNRLYPVDTTEPPEWYIWEGSVENSDEGRYVPCAIPEKFHNVIGWGF